MNTYLTKTKVKTEPELTSVAALNLQDTLYFSELLLRLGDMGTDMVYILSHKTKDKAYCNALAADQVLELADTYVLLSRCMRRMAYLVPKLTDPARKGGRSRVAAREQIIRRVEDALGRGAPAGAEIEEDIVDRPMAEIMTEICSDFGLRSLAGIERYKQHAPAYIAELSARTPSLDLREWAAMLLREPAPG